jgi:serine/threonine protein kinase
MNFTALREITILKEINHENIVKVFTYINVFLSFAKQKLI